MINNFLNQIKSFALAKCLISAIEVGLFEELQKKPLKAEQIKSNLQLADSPIIDAFLEVLSEFDILSCKNGYFHIGQTITDLVPIDQNIKEWTKEMGVFYTSLDNLTELLQTGDYSQTALAKYWSYKTTKNREKLNKIDVQDYSLVMESSQTHIAEVLSKKYNFNKYKRIVDVGGGTGKLSIILALQNPEPLFTVIELPAVCKITKERIKEAGLEKRISVVPLDFFKNPSCNLLTDCLLFVRVLHDWTTKETRILLERWASHVKEKGSLFIVEPMKEDQKSGISSLMLALLGGSGRRSTQEYTKILLKLGFKDLDISKCTPSSCWSIRASK